MSWNIISLETIQLFVHFFLAAFSSISFRIFSHILQCGWTRLSWISDSSRWVGFRSVSMGSGEECAARAGTTATPASPVGNSATLTPRFVKHFLLFYRPQRSYGRVIFSQASVILFTGGMHGRGVCVAGGHAWQGGMRGRVSGSSPFSSLLLGRVTSN